jgi:AcrR family transcriptional regulator
MAARDLLLDAGERLIAERGLDVSVRDIALAADQRNNSAVQYHFGSRDGLVDAVIERRMRTIERRQMDLLAELEASGEESVQRLVGVLVSPQLELIRSGVTHYARFLEAVRNHPVIADRARLDGADRAAVKITTLRLERALSSQPPAQRRRRLASMATAMFALVADLERAATAPGSRMTGARFDAAAGDVIVMLAGMLIAGERESTGLHTTTV